MSVIEISRQLPANLTPKKLTGGVVKIAFVVVALVLAISHCATAQQATGGVCVAVRVDDPLWKTTRNSSKWRDQFFAIEAQPCLGRPNTLPYFIPGPVS
jgi:hypothetical protein